MVVDREFVDRLKKNKDLLWSEYKAAEERWAKASNLYEAAKKLLEFESSMVGDEPGTLVGPFATPELAQLAATK